VPVIAKSDNLSLDERDAFKSKIREELVYQLYPFGTDENDEEENESIRLRVIRLLQLV